MGSKGVFTPKLIIIALTSLVVLALGYYYFTKTAIVSPFPLDDQNARYYIENLSEDNFVLNYAKNTDPQHPNAIYISKETKVPIKQYLGKNLTVEGRFVKETHKVTCIQAPCPPQTSTFIYIETIKVKN